MKQIQLRIVGPMTIWFFTINRKFIHYILVTSLVLISFNGFTQETGNDGPPDICPEEPCDNEVPITGIEYLLLAGGALGLRMLKKSGKK